MTPPQPPDRVEAPDVDNAARIAQVAERVRELYLQHPEEAVLEHADTLVTLSDVVQELAKLRADIAYRQEEKEITLHVQDEYSTALRTMARRAVQWKLNTAKQGEAAYRLAAANADLRSDQVSYEKDQEALTRALHAARAENVELAGRLEQAEERLVEIHGERNAARAAVLVLELENEELRAAAPSAPSVEPEPVGDVREEWGYQAPGRDRPTPQSTEVWATLSAKQTGGTVYRRTVTTMPWVAVPPTVEPEDGEGR